MDELDATATAELVRRGELGVLEVVDAAIARAEAVNPELNAIVAPAFDAARVRARSFGGQGPASRPLAGVPVLLKDLQCAKAGETAYQGNRLLHRLDHRHRYTSAVARRLHEAGSISLGRSHSPELGCGNCTASAETELYGPTRNPWDPTRTAMGSSGGAAAAVAANIVPIAHGSDGGGSIRMPASACGLVGLKPSRARISSAPAGEGWAGGLCDGVLSRTVRDTALALDVLSGPEPGDPYAAVPFAGRYVDALARRPPALRVGICTGLPYARTHPECRQAVLAAGALLEGLGHRVEESHPAALDRLAYLYDYILIIRTSLAVEMNVLARRLGREWTPDDVEDGTWINYRRGRRIGAADYAAAIGRLHQWAREVVAWWHRDHDLLVLPVLATPPPAVGYLVEGDERVRRERLAATIPFTPQFNVTGQPAISLPLHTGTGGWPIGVQLVAAPGREDLLLQLAAVLEEAAPWRARRPRIRAR